MLGASTMLLLLACYSLHDRLPTGCPARPLVTTESSPAFRQAVQDYGLSQYFWNALLSTGSLSLRFRLAKVFWDDAGTDTECNGWKLFR